MGRLPLAKVFKVFGMQPGEVFPGPAPCPPAGMEPGKPSHVPSLREDKGNRTAFFLRVALADYFLKAFLYALND
jgi:hypothetical protein